MSLLLAEQNNDLLMRYSKLRPHRLTPLLDANKAAEDKKESKESNHVQSDRPHGRDRGGWKGRGCGHYNSSGRGNHYNRGCRPNFGHGRGRGGCEMAEDKNILVVDSGSSHTILKDKRYFLNLTLKNANISTITGIASLIEGHGQAHILLPKGTHLEISDALYSPSSKRSLLSFKDIRLNGFHIETKGEGNKEFLNIIEITQGHKKVLETIPALSTGLYYAKIDMIEANMAMNKEFIEKFTLWHDRLGHPDHSMMRKLMINSRGHILKEKRVIPKNLTCEACSQGKLIIRPSPAKVNKETLNFLERIQGDICGPIHPPCGTFRYYMVLIDASTRWSHVCLLFSRNHAFARLLAQIIRLRAHFLDFPLKTLRLDNAGEFTSQAFNDYCMSMGVSVEHPVAHVHTQNGLAESFIKRIQLIARPLLMRSELPVAAWGHAVLHASELIRIRPSSEHKYSPSELLTGHEPDISHLKIFGCAVYVPIALPHRTKMGPQRRMGIYVGFDSPTIIKYLEPTTGDLFKARYADCHFNESEFPTLGGETNKLVEEISWNQTSLNWQDPRTLACESEVHKIINLQKLANELPDSFVDPKKVTKSYIPACNAPVRIDVQKRINEFATESNARKKRGRPIVYVDDLNILGNSGEIAQTVEYLKKEFEMKDLGKTKFCLGLQLEYVNNGILVHQKAYTEKVLKRFNMDQAHPLSSPMVVRSLGLDRDPFGPKKDEEEVLGPEVPYLSAIGALMYLASHTRPDICFAVNLLSRFSSCPTQRHWNGIKHLLRYLQGTVDLGLFYTNYNKEGLVGFADAGYQSDPHNGKSQTGYVFTHGGTAISWRSMKQTISATSSNHAEILAIHEASRECVWLRSMTQHVRSNCGMDDEKGPTVMYEDNAACIAQLKEGYIKGDRTKHILPKFFFTHDLQKDGEVQVVQNKEDRSRYFWAINSNSAKKMLKELDTVHYAGLVVYTGTVLNEEGHEFTYTRKFEPNFEPFGPMTASLYQFDSRFHIAALQRLLDEGDCYGVIVMDRKGILFATIRDNRHEFHDTYTFPIELMWSHQVRVDMAYPSYYDKVAELATKYFTSNSHPNMKGLILLGMHVLHNCMLKTVVMVVWSCIFRRPYLVYYIKKYLYGFNFWINLPLIKRRGF
ncbi:Integrase catalytic core [Arabidopsis thaliana x Arabidopsis arenosa]|uniref:Integrase catalytic core n=1 Tax=Arabidopsis thaliana x Arabidopsis arenosa TaxID=1240361 RepID=A0A8T2C8R6_9BRAS|nr:Integrase catalytic core [Arabidopsis thaliana x Arabidopsis arenosa]